MSSLFLNGANLGLTNVLYVRDQQDVLDGKGGPIEAPDRTAETERQEELHVLREVQWVREQPHVARVIRERGLEVHGFIFDKGKLSCVRLIGAGSD